MRKFKNSFLTVLCVLATLFALVACATTSSGSSNKESAGKTSESSVGGTVIELVVEDAQTEFRWNEKFKFGGKVNAKFEDGTEKAVTTGYTIDSTAFKVGKAGEYDIVVSYGGKEYTYQVTVAQAPLSALEVTGMKTEFNWGEEFVFDGQVKTKYANGDLEAIDESKYVVDSSAFDSQKAGTYAIEVVYTENESIKARYEVTVLGLEAVSLRIDSYNEDISVLSTFDVSDVTGCYVMDNDTEEPMTADNTVVEIIDYKEFTLGSYDVKITRKDNADLTQTISVNFVKPEKVSILFIGNSFSDDTSTYIPNILKNLGYKNIEIGNMFIGGCTIDTHYSNIMNNTAAYDFRYNNGTGWNMFVGNEKKSVQFGIGYKEWDIISLQQASGSSGMPKTYANLDKLATEVKKLATNPKAKIVFNMTWAYQQDCTHAEFPNYNNNQQAMYNAILNTVQTKVKFPVIPCGTAVQNARTSFMGDNLTLDGYHLNEYIGRYIAALTVVSSLLNDDLSKLSWVPERVSAEQKAVAVESALNAAKTPFAVTNSVYNQVVKAIELSDLKTEYEFGEEFVFDGVVTEKYENGSSKVIDASKYTVDYDDYNSQIPGTYTITVTHVTNPSISCDYTVTVKGVELVDLRIDSFNQDISVLSTFDVSDVTGCFLTENGTEVPMTANNTVIEIIDHKEFTLGEYEVKISNLENANLTKTIDINVVKPDKVRILFIGNSFSDDTSTYLPDVLKNLGYENVEIGNMFIGGCTIDMHYQNVVNNAEAYDFRFHNGRYWNNLIGNKKQSIKYAVEYKDWDIISLQQASGSSGVADTYSNLDKLADEVKKLTTNPKAKIVFNMTWAYQQDSTHAEFPKYNNSQTTMYNAILNTVQTKVKYPVMPCGTAIQNARTSFLGDTLTRDGYHLNEYIGRYIASLTVASMLLDDDLSTLTWVPSNVNGQQKTVAIESALNAVKTPYDVTESAY